MMISAKSVVSTLLKRCVSTLILLTASVSAFAHHPLGGATPDTFTNGLLSGVGHPIVELDHFAFVLAAAVLAASLQRTTSLVSCFLAASVGAVFLGSQGVALPGLEMLILASLFIAGIALIVNRQRASTLAPLFFLAAGLVHGLAYSEAIIGAETSPMAAYLIGIFMIQLVISMLVIKLVRILKQRSTDTWLPTRVAGGITLGVSIALAVQALETALPVS